MVVYRFVRPGPTPASFQKRLGIDECPQWIESCRSAHSRNGSKADTTLMQHFAWKADISRGQSSSCEELSSVIGAGLRPVNIVGPLLIFLRRPLA